MLSIQNVLIKSIMGSEVDFKLPQVFFPLRTKENFRKGNLPKDSVCYCLMVQKSGVYQLKCMKPSPKMVRFSIFDVNFTFCMY